MADFRKWFIALAVVALMAISANAQIGQIPTDGGSANSLLACVATAAGTPELRPEGYTELVGDIVISCTGGPDLVVGTKIPTTNIVIYMTPNTPITSRLLEKNGASEALLIIDDAGSNLSTGVVGYGPQAPQTLCTSDQQQAVGGSTCPAYVGQVAGVNGNYEVAVTTPTGTTAAQNVYQGKVGDFGPNTVAFYNVPVLPPATTGLSRTFRITNIRIPAVSQYLAINATQGAFISTSPSQVLPVSQTVLNVGVVGPAMTAAVAANSTPFQQCNAVDQAQTASLWFTEGFATSFKTRVVPGGAANGTLNNAAGNTLYAAEGTNLAAPSNQNIPGGLYGGFAANSESGFIFPSLTSTVSGHYTAGLADFGTRLKAVFTNIPAGLTLYVSTTSIDSIGAYTGTNAAIPGGTSLTPFAVLVGVNSGEATSDGTNFAPVSASIGVPYAISATSAGTATAVWEVTNANPSAIDSLQFGVYISYSPTAATTTYPYGTPITGLPLGSPVNNVALSFAPEPGGGSFTSAGGPTALSAPIPRFAIYKVYQGPWVNINLCQTTLLYPFVTGASGFDTGVAVANTSMDPWNTPHQVGSCTLYGYGVSVAASGNTAAQPVIPGCDFISNPLQGTNCFPVVPSGQVGTVLASAALTNFQGYVIAVCNFQYAHGYAAVTDLGIRNLWSSYLALELSPAGVGANRGYGIETLAH